MTKVVNIVNEIIPDNKKKLFQKCNKIKSKTLAATLEPFSKVKRPKVHFIKHN